MSMQGEPARLDVSAAIEHGALRSTRALHRTAENPTIDSIALISRPEQARRVPPLAAVVISAGPQTSGWLVSSVLRYAWERRASVVVAAGEQPDSVLVLAQRLDITLLTSDGDPTLLALALSADIGAANAAVESQLVALLRVVQRERTVDGMLRAASAELGGLPLELIFRDAVVASSGSTDRAGTAPLGPYRIADAADDEVVVTAYPPRTAGRTAFAGAALELLVPSLRAAWFESEAVDRLDGLTAAAIVEDDVSRPAVVGQLGWRADEAHVVVFLRPAADASRELGNVVRLLWRRAMGRGALTTLRGGWIAVLATDDDGVEVVAALREKLAPALAELGVGVGISSADADPARLPGLVTEARLAARCAWGGGAGSVASFADLQLGAVGYLFDPADARLVAELVLPDFVAAPDLAVLVESVAAFVDEGSVSAAASALSVHRNTLTARLDRARALGLPIGEPGLALSVAAVVRALQPGLQSGTDLAPDRKDRPR